MSTNKKPYRINGKDVVVLAENAVYNGSIEGVTDAQSAIDNLDSRLQVVEGEGGGGSGTPSSLKILTIGNSFCYNLFFYMSGVLSNLGISNVTCYNLYHGGMTPAGWWDYWNREQNGGVEYYCGPHITAMDSFAGSAATAYDAVSATDWDVIILQQFHTNAPSYASLLPNIAHLVAHIRQACPNRKVKVGMNMEWPRSIDSAANNGPKGILGYEAIVEEIKAAYDGGNLDFIVPNGTAIMNAAYNSTLNTLMPSGSSYASDRSAEAGGTTHAENPLLLSQITKNYGNDKLHLANGVGLYVIAGCFVEAVIRPLLGKSIVDSTYTASAYSSDTGSIAVTAENRGLCHAAALYAVANPFTRSELNAKNF